MRRKITTEEFERLCVALDHLAHILAAVGVVEFSVSKQTKEIHWDTEGGGKINPKALALFEPNIESLLIDVLEVS